MKWVICVMLVMFAIHGQSMGQDAPAPEVQAYLQASAAEAAAQLPKLRTELLLLQRGRINAEAETQKLPNGQWVFRSAAAKSMRVTEAKARVEAAAAGHLPLPLLSEQRDLVAPGDIGHAGRVAVVQVTSPTTAVVQVCYEITRPNKHTGAAEIVPAKSQMFLLSGVEAAGWAQGDEIEINRELQAFPKQETERGNLVELRAFDRAAYASARE